MVTQNVAEYIPEKIEAMLFMEGGTLSKSHLLHTLQITEESLAQALEQLSQLLTGHGLCLVVSETDVSLRISHVVSDFIIEQEKASQSEDIGPASIETLSILIYRGPSSQSEIDSIRGVNSSYALRQLRVRGLVEKTSTKGKTIYSVTSSTIAHLGLTSVSDMPERESMVKAITEFEKKMSEQK